jgi:hypothetical protein
LSRSRPAASRLKVWPAKASFVNAGGADCRCPLFTTRVSLPPSGHPRRDLGADAGRTGNPEFLRALVICSRAKISDEAAWNKTDKSGSARSTDNLV